MSWRRGHAPAYEVYDEDAFLAGVDLFGDLTAEPLQAGADADVAHEPPPFAHEPPPFADEPARGDDACPGKHPRRPRSLTRMAPALVAAALAFFAVLTLVRLTADRRTSSGTQIPSTGPASPPSPLLEAAGAGPAHRHAPPARAGASVSALGRRPPAIAAAPHLTLVRAPRASDSQARPRAAPRDPPPSSPAMATPQQAEAPASLARQSPEFGFEQ